MALDKKLNFQEYLKNKFYKVNETIGLLWKLQKILPRGPLLIIYKSFIRPHLDYGMLFMINTIIILSTKN